ncbi:MAG: toxin-antitoxin system YwqK family antitoxin [Limisphaerales bacterium]
MRRLLVNARMRPLLLGLGCLSLAACSPPEVASPPTVPRAALVLKDGLLYRPAQSAPFTGIVVERYPAGQMQSLSVISNGLLHGLSEGWHTNGTLQVREHFIAGKSHGTRTKWYPNGAKLSEATIVEGRLHGTFCRWHENGVLAEEIELREDQPSGLSLAYYPSGCLKVRARIENGKFIGKETFKDGEMKGLPVVVAADAAKPKS